MLSGILNVEWFMPWRTISNENDKPQVEFELEKVVRGFFRPDLFDFRPAQRLRATFAGHFMVTDKKLRGWGMRRARWLAPWKDSLENRRSTTIFPVNGVPHGLTSCLMASGHIKPIHDFWLLVLLKRHSGGGRFRAATAGNIIQKSALVRVGFLRE